jgi:flagellar hook-basal body complex protein FliE
MTSLTLDKEQIHSQNDPNKETVDIQKLIVDDINDLVRQKNEHSHHQHHHHHHHHHHEHEHHPDAPPSSPKRSHHHIPKEASNNNDSSIGSTRSFTTIETPDDHGNTDNQHSFGGSIGAKAQSSLSAHSSSINSGSISHYGSSISSSISTTRASILSFAMSKKAFHPPVVEYCDCLPANETPEWAEEFSRLLKQANNKAEEVNQDEEVVRYNERMFRSVLYSLSVQSEKLLQAEMDVQGMKGKGKMKDGKAKEMVIIPHATTEDSSSGDKFDETSQVRSICKQYKTFTEVLVKNLNDVQDKTNRIDCEAQNLKNRRSVLLSKVLIQGRMVSVKLYCNHRLVGTGTLGTTRIKIRWTGGRKVMKFSNGCTQSALDCTSR